MSNVVIITAAGQGKRMGGPKQFIELNGQPMLKRTLNVFESCSAVDGIILVVDQTELKRAEEIRTSKVLRVVAGGFERYDSVLNGLKVLPGEAEIVLIHDGARPFVTTDVIVQAIEETKKSGAVVVGVPVKDTIKQINNEQLTINNEGAIIQKTLNRASLWQAQTPQVFKKEIILKAYEQAKDNVTDDAMLVEKMGLPVVMITGSYDNIKVTTQEDLKIAKVIMEGRR